MASRVLLLSPHPDDIAWSLGGTLTRLHDAGVGVWTLTFFTRSRYAPGHPAQDVEHVSAVRAAEERRWADSTGVLLLRGELPDAGLRGFDDDTELGAEPEQDIVLAATDLLHDVLGTLDVDAVFAPGSRGGHVDHAAVRRAAEQLPAGLPLLHYDDLPYATRLVPRGGRHRIVVDIDDRWDAKEAGMRHFPSQCWQDTVPVARAHAASVGGEQIWTDSSAGAALLYGLPAPLAGGPLAATPLAAAP
jgi:LmbE family N-acetylglucosaminyl deacetylase